MFVNRLISTRFDLSVRIAIEVRGGGHKLPYLSFPACMQDCPHQKHICSWSKYISPGVHQFYKSDPTPLFSTFRVTLLKVSSAPCLFILVHIIHLLISFLILHIFYHTLHYELLCYNTPYPTKHMNLLYHCIVLICWKILDEVVFYLSKGK